MVDTTLALKLAKVLKAYPLSWWTGLGEDYHISKDKLRQQLYGLEKNGFIAFKNDITGSKLIYLTEKGYSKIEDGFKTDYIYRSFNERRKGLGASEEHRYMMFRFLVSYLTSKKEPLKVLSYNNKSAKITTQIFGTEVFTIPDLIIFHNNAIDFVEVDTGLETSHQIYLKLIKYFSIIINKPESIDAERFNLYFSLSNQRSLTTLFGTENMKNNGLVYKHFEKFSNNIEVSKNRSININTSDILKVLKEKKVKIYAGFVKSAINDYKFVDLIKEIKNATATSN